MKKKFRNSFIILFSAFFFMLSSGIVITLHECCSKHVHAKNEHNHCHETKILVKIEGEFVKSETACFSSPLVETVLFFYISVNEFFEKTTPIFEYPIPPLLKLVGINFLNFTSQRIYYS
ncbi:MAG: hypothetical protein FWC34_11905 [Bacteroidetes bacterium]|nr:hypothetical protein [Bacteroidota bacterium]MCL2302119.1 hypothetical protein [Lentimicrobiaceae bacterium]